MEQNIIKFNGSNEKLLARYVVDNLASRPSLIVPETHNAILIKDGQMLQTLSSGKYVLTDFLDIKTELNSSIEVLFMSKTAKLKLRWGTANKLLMFDEALQENYHLGLSGDFEVQVGDPRKCYLYLVGVSEDLTSDALQERLMSNVVSVVETVVVEFVQANNIPFNKIATYKKEMSQKVLTALSHKLMSEYGIAVFSFNIANIIIDSEELNRMNSHLKGQAKVLVCSGCGAPLNENDKFCSKCGKSTSASDVCPTCGKQVPTGSAFCPSCGQKL